MHCSPQDRVAVVQETLYGWNSTEGEEGRKFDFGVCSDCLELLGLLVCGAGGGGVFSSDSTRPRYGMGHGADWKASDAAWLSCL